MEKLNQKEEKAEKGVTRPRLQKITFLYFYRETVEKIHDNLRLSSLGEEELEYLYVLMPPMRMQIPRHFWVFRSIGKLASIPHGKESQGLTVGSEHTESVCKNGGGI